MSILPRSWNKSAAEEFEAIINKHINTFSPIKGTHRGVEPALHYFDEVSKLNVMTDMSGNLIGGWKLSLNQVKYLLLTGAVK